MEKSSHHTSPGAGKSSFELIDASLFFRGLALVPGMTMVDIACGKGAYAIAASDIVGNSGLIYAIDLWEEGIVSLNRHIAAHNIRNIRTILSDVSTRIPIESDAADICLLATVLHDFVESQIAEEVLKEVVRMLKPQGHLAIMEFKKIEGPPGPPMAIRLSPEEVESIVAPYGFKKDLLSEVGPYNYLTVFSS
jgi:ubiquinone/menaquinone biosynthesis C-methylase UbiE